MATSITGSTVSPFTGLILSDANYTVTGSFPTTAGSASTSPLYFPNLDYPTVGKIVVQLTGTALTNSSGSLTNYVRLDESNDGNIWNAIAVFTASLLPFVDGGALSSPAPSSVQVLLTPQAKPYLRASGVAVTGGYASGGITGSYTLTALFTA